MLDVGDIISITERFVLVSAGNTRQVRTVVEEVEAYFARVLGKERALFMPTGTLANHLALRTLAGDRRRVVLQEVSHVYNDTGDSAQILSGLTLLPVAPDRATFTWADVEAAGNPHHDEHAAGIHADHRRNGNIRPLVGFGTGQEQDRSCCRGPGRDDRGE